MCPGCVITVDGWCIKCEQDEAYQRAFEIDLVNHTNLVNHYNYHTQKNSAEHEDQFKIQEEVVRSKRLKKFGEYLPKKNKLEKEKNSDVNDSEFQLSKGTFERHIFLSLWLCMRLPYFL